MFGRDLAFILQAKPYRETGFIIKAYLKNKGLMSFIIQGVRGKVKRKQHFQLFRPYELVYYDSHKSELKRIKDIKSITPDPGNDPLRSVVSTFCADIFLQSVKEEEGSQSLYELLAKYVVLFDEDVQESDAHILFCRDLILLLGLLPDSFPKDPKLRFALVEAEMIDPANYADTRNLLDENDSLLFGRFISAESSIAKNGEERYQLLKIICHYLEIQQPGFKEPLSLDVLHQMLY